MKPAPAAMALLLAGLLWNNAWKWFPAQHGGRVFVAGSGLFIAFLLSGLAVITKSQAVRIVCILIIGFALQVFGCNAWYIVAPWHINPGDELCSSRLGFPLGLAGLWVTILVVQYLYVRGRHGDRR